MAARTGAARPKENPLRGYNPQGLKVRFLDNLNPGASIEVDHQQNIIWDM